MFSPAVIKRRSTPKLRALVRGVFLVADRLVRVDEAQLREARRRRVRILSLEPPHLVVDLTGLNRRAARTVDAHDHALRVLVLERSLQSRNDVLGTGATFVLDHADQLDDGSVLAGDNGVIAFDPSCE